MTDTPLVTDIYQLCIQSQCNVTVLHKAQHLFITQKNIFDVSVTVHHIYK